MLKKKEDFERDEGCVGLYHESLWVCYLSVRFYGPSLIISTLRYHGSLFDCFYYCLEWRYLKILKKEKKCD